MIGGDFPIQLQLRQDIACLKYSELLEDPKVCVLNPHEIKMIRTKKIFLSLNPGNDIFFIKIDGALKARPMRHSEFDIIYKD
jgi:hypothetical protein